MTQTDLREIPPLQHGPAAWLGPEMASRRDWISELSDADVAELETALERFLGLEGDVAQRIGRMTAAEARLVYSVVARMRCRRSSSKA